MAQLPQSNIRLAEKQVSNVTPASMRYQQPVQNMGGQNNEATIKAIIGAIDVGAEVYQKMEDATVDLEIQEERALLAQHINNMTVIRENGTGKAEIQQLNPQAVKIAFESTDGSFQYATDENGNATNLYAYKVRDSLSDKAKEKMQPVIDVANSNFVRDTQISFAKEIKNRGVQNLALQEETLLTDYASTLVNLNSASLNNPNLRDPNVFYESRQKNTADEFGNFMNTRLFHPENGAVAKGYLTVEDANARLLKFRQKLALATLQSHVSFNPERALKLLQTDSDAYQVNGVPVPAKERLSFVSRVARENYFKHQGWNEQSFKTKIQTGLNQDILEKQNFLTKLYNVNYKKGKFNRYEPKNESVYKLSKRYNLKPAFVKLTLERAVSNIRPLIPGAGLPDKDYKLLVNNIENDYLTMTTHGDNYGNQAFSTAEKNGTLNLLNNSQKEKLFKVKETWDEVLDLSQNFSKEQLPYLLKKQEILKEKLRDDTGKYTKASKVIRNFFQEALEPWLDQMVKTPRTFILKQSNLLNADISWTDAKTEKETLKKNYSKFGIKRPPIFWLTEEEFKKIENNFRPRRGNKNE